MSLHEITSYLAHRRRQAPGGAGEDERLVRVGEASGTESFCFFMYSLVRLEKPRVVVELGTGVGGTAALCALATAEAGRGHVWTVDDGRDWPDLRRGAQAALGYDRPKESYGTFIRRLFQRFGVADHVTYVNKRMSATEFYAPPKPIDILFADAQDSGPLGCLHVLRYYLPRMSAHSSLFIDRASTINHSALFLNYLVAELQRGRIPLELREHQPAARVRRMKEMVETSKISLIHLTEPRFQKPNRLQNSRAWLRIEPNHFTYRDEVDSFAHGQLFKPTY